MAHQNWGEMCFPLSYFGKAISSSRFLSLVHWLFFSFEELREKRDGRIVLQFVSYSLLNIFKHTARSVCFTS